MAVLAAVWGLVAVVACLFAEAKFLGLQLGRFGLTLATGALYAIPVFLWTWAIVCGYAAFSRRKAPHGLVSLALNSGQCVPAIIFFSIVTPTGLAALLALGVNAAYVLAYLIADPEERPTRRTLAFVIAAGFQAALCLKALREPILAALAIEVGVVATFALLRSFGWRFPSARTSWRNSLASLIVALSLASWMAFTGRMPIPATARAAQWPKLPVPEDRDNPGAASGSEAIDAAGMVGVILWPEVSATTTLVAPLPVWRAMSDGHLAADASIPFSGEYWFFEPPHPRPPPASTVRRGSPLKTTFHTISGDPLRMEAHQKLPVPVSFACCRSIEVYVRSEDDVRHGMVMLELVLIHGDDRVSLDERPVTGSRLEFPMPARPPFAQFDEIGIVFHRVPRPIGASAKLAIERFVLVR